MKKIIELLKSKKLSGYTATKEGLYGGENIKILEKDWAKYFGVRHAIAVNSATSGIWCALNAFSDYKFANASMYKNITDEVIVTPYSMSASSSLPLFFGMKPVFADIEKDYFCMSLKEIKRKVNVNTKGIITVNLFGMPCDPEIYKFAKKRGLWVIEDNAQGIGAKCNGQFTGTFGDVGIFSLNQHKHLNAGEGGIIVTNDDYIAFRLRASMNHGECVSKQFIVGLNLRMTEITALIAREELKSLTGILKKYRASANDFNIPVRENCISSYYVLPSFEKVEDDDYNVRKGYVKPIYTLPIFRALGYRQNNLCPICEDVENRIYIYTRKEVI